MSIALQGVDVKDTFKRPSVFSKDLAITAFGHKRHKRQYLMCFLILPAGLSRPLQIATLNICHPVGKHLNHHGQLPRTGQPAPQGQSRRDPSKPPGAHPDGAATRRGTTATIPLAPDRGNRTQAEGQPSVFDMIRVLGGQKAPHKAWERLVDTHTEVLTKCQNLQFPGPGQRETPGRDWLKPTQRFSENARTLSKRRRRFFLGALTDLQVALQGR